VVTPRIGHVNANRLRTSPCSIVVDHAVPSGRKMHVSPPNLKEPPTFGSIRAHPQNHRARCSIRRRRSNTTGRDATIRRRYS